MVPFMVDRLWRAVSMVFWGRVNISFTHACTIKNSSSDIVFKSSLGHLSGPGALPGLRQCSTYFAISRLVSAPRNLPCVPNAVLCALISSLVIRSSAAIFPLLCRKSVKRQHPWQKATSSRLLCSAVSCGILAQVLLALPQFVMVGSGRRPCARGQSVGETHLRQHHDGGRDGGEGGAFVGVSDVRTHSSLKSHSLHVAVGLYPCDS